MNKIKLTQTFGIYQVKNLINDKVYVGSTNRSFSIRWGQWKSNLRYGKANKYLQNSWNKHGKENFEFSVLEVLTDKALVIEREQYWIDKLDSTNPEKGYNICPKAGIGPSSLGRKDSEETKLKKSIAHLGHEGVWKGKKLSEEHKQKISEVSKKPKSEEHRKKLSDSKKGSLNPAYGRKASEETKAKMSLTQRNRFKL